MTAATDESLRASSVDPAARRILDRRTAATRAAVASLPFRDARAGMRLRLPAGAHATLLAPYPLVDSIEARIAVVDRGARSFRSRRCRISSDMASRSGTATSGSRGQPRCIRLSSPARPEAPKCHRPAGRSRQSSSRGWCRAASRSRRSLLHTGVASLEDHEPPYEEFYRVPGETAERVKRRHARAVALSPSAPRWCARSKP